jgi:heme exporter protein CcmD
MIPVYEEKYVFAIWSCYAITAVVLVALLVYTLWRAGRVRRELEQLDGQRRRAPAKPAREAPQ